MREEEVWRGVTSLFGMFVSAAIVSEKLFPEINISNPVRPNVTSAPRPGSTTDPDLLTPWQSPKGKPWKKEEKIIRQKFQ